MKRNWLDVDDWEIDYHLSLTLQECDPSIHPHNSAHLIRLDTLLRQHPLKHHHDLSNLSFTAVIELQPRCWKLEANI